LSKDLSLAFCGFNQLIFRNNETSIYDFVNERERGHRQPTNSFHKKKYNLAGTKSLPSCLEILLECFNHKE
jgi:hypothetical protein